MGSDPIYATHPRLRRPLFQSAGNAGHARHAPRSSAFRLVHRSAPATSSPTAPSPRRPRPLMRDWGCHVIAGNCEEQLAAAAEDCACGFEEGSECDLLAKGWYPFANALLSPASRAWMAALPKTLTFTSAGCASASSTAASTSSTASCSPPSATCSPRSWSGPAPTWSSPATPACRSSRRSAGAPGSIPASSACPPTTAAADVWYGLIELDAGRIVLSTHRLAYDHVGAAAAMRRAGHADGYARTLITGLWPSLDIFPPPERAATAKRLRRRTLRLEPLAGARVGRSPSPRLRGEGQGEGRPQAPTEFGLLSPARPSAPWSISARVFSTP